MDITQSQKDPAEDMKQGQPDYLEIASTDSILMKIDNTIANSTTIDITGEEKRRKGYSEIAAADTIFKTIDSKIANSSQVDITSEETLTKNISEEDLSNYTGDLSTDQILRKLDRIVGRPNSKS